MNFMKRLIAVPAAVFLCGTAAFAGSSSISIDPPTVSGTGVDDQINAQIKSEFDAVTADLNSDYFNKFHDQTDLARGFANANSVTRDNASMMGFQNYDIFCVMLGANAGFSYPGTSYSEIGNSFKNIKNKGDVYAGMGTGGFVGQVGVNTSFLVENLYLSAKFGTYSFNQDFGDNKLKIDQFMMGVGANYRLLSSWDFLFGLAKWRGVSLGTGLVYNSTDVKFTIPIEDQNFMVPVSSGAYTSTLQGHITDINARLGIETSSIVIPLEATTSVQVLWLFNLGVGAGVDIIIPNSTIKLGGNANAYVDDPGSGVTSNPGTVSVVGTNSENKLKFTDVIAPRLAADLGLNFSVVKIDLPVSWYPLTKAFSVGLSAGVAW